MIRARFHANYGDYRSVKWPVKYPYWCTGYGEDYSVVVAFAENEAEILRNWPEATNIYIEEVEKPWFNDRFQKPDWYEENK